MTTVVRDTAEAVHVDVEGSVTALPNPGPDHEHDEVDGAVVIVPANGVEMAGSMGAAVVDEAGRFGKSMSRPYLVLYGCKSDVTCVVVGGCSFAVPIT